MCTPVQCCADKCPISVDRLRTVLDTEETIHPSGGLIFSAELKGYTCLYPQNHRNQSLKEHETVYFSGIFGQDGGFHGGYSRNVGVREHIPSCLARLVSQVFLPGLVPWGLEYSQHPRKWGSDV